MWWHGMLTGTALRRTTCSACASSLTCASWSLQTDTRQAFPAQPMYLCRVVIVQQLGEQSFAHQWEPNDLIMLPLCS